MREQRRPHDGIKRDDKHGPIWALNSRHDSEIQPKLTIPITGEVGPAPAARPDEAGSVVWIGMLMQNYSRMVRGIPA